MKRSRFGGRSERVNVGRSIGYASKRPFSGGRFETKVIAEVLAANAAAAANADVALFRRRIRSEGFAVVPQKSNPRNAGLCGNKLSPGDEGRHTAGSKVLKVYKNRRC